MTPELLFNKSGLLSMSSSQIELFHRIALGELSRMSAQEIRTNQYEHYLDAISATIGVDIRSHPENCPFFQTTGFPLKTFLLDRWKFSPKDVGCYVNCIGTDFISAEYLHSMQKAVKNPDDICDWYKRHTTKSVAAMERLRTIGPLLLDKKKDWQLNYSVLSFSVYRKGCDKIPTAHCTKGIIVLEPEPLQKILPSKNFEKIYKMLVEVGTWFNHDFLGHGTLDYTGGYPETYRTKKISNKKLKTWEIYYTKTPPKDPNRGHLTYCDEQRQLSLYMEIAKSLYKLCPATKRFIRMHAYAFCKLLYETRYEERFSILVSEYFLGVYLFCLSRILPFKDLIALVNELGEGYVLNKIHTMNPGEANIIHFLRKSTGAPYNKKGLKPKPEDWTWKNLGFVPHKKVFQSAYKHAIPKSVKII